MDFKTEKACSSKNKLCASSGTKNVDPFGELLLSSLKEEDNFKPLCLRDAESKLITEKTYSRKNELCAALEKKNIDPFDKLLLSPLKQEVNFVPLCLWEAESKKKKDSKWRMCRINYELYDSDDPDSPCRSMSSLRSVARLSNDTANNTFGSNTSEGELTITESPLLFKTNDKLIKGFNEFLRKDNVSLPYPSQEIDVSDLATRVSGLTTSNDAFRGPSAETSSNQATSFESITKSDISRHVTRRRRYDIGKWKRSKTRTKEGLGKSCFEENESCAVLSCSSMMFDKSFMNHTVRVIKAEKSIAFKSALELDPENPMGEDSSLSCTARESSFIKPKDFILRQCGQEEVLPFEVYFNERTLTDCKKIGEGVYGEVFMFDSDSVIKIIPIEGSSKVNGEPQKTFEEIIPEVVIASKLSSLRHGKRYRTSGFSEIKRCWCVVGKYPEYLLRLWDEYDQAGSGSENDSPAMFKSDQLYIILELVHGGQDLESYVFSTSAQSLSVFVQSAFSLAAAEKEFQFEHRDLHWGNLLIAPTKEKFMAVVLNNVEYKIPTKGVKVSIIDFTLSRISHEDCCIFNDLSADPSLFASQGDYQFEIYRMMQMAVKDDWSLFAPKTNIYWLHYTIDKMLKMVRYKYNRGNVQKKGIKFLKNLETVIMEHEDSFNFVLKENLISKLS